MQNTRHRVLRPLVLGIAVAAIVAAALMLIVGEGDIRAAGQLAVMILGRGATAILHCVNIQMVGHLHFMTRRPLQQLPFLRRVPRECSPVGQYISIGPSKKERRNYYACGRDASAFRAKRYSQPRSLSRDALLWKSGAGIAHTDDRFLSLLRRPRPRSVNNRSMGESYHAACLVSSWEFLSALERLVRTHRRRNFTLTLYRRFTDDIHYPLAAIPFAERIARLFFSSLLRGALRHLRHFLLAVRIVPTFHLTHQSFIHLCATISVDQ